MKLLIHLFALALVTTALAFSNPIDYTAKDIGSKVSLRKVSSLKLPPAQYKAFQKNQKAKGMLYFKSGNQIAARRGYVLLQSNNKSFLIFPSRSILPATKAGDATVAVVSSGSRQQFILMSKKNIFGIGPAGSGVMLACYCRGGGSQNCGNWPEDVDDECQGDCCGPHADLITPGGILETEGLY